jgi:hypothetical protein
VVLHLKPLGQEADRGLPCGPRCLNREQRLVLLRLDASSRSRSAFAEVQEAPDLITELLENPFLAALPSS